MDGNDLAVASKLGHIEAILERNGEDFRRLEVRLFGEQGEQDGGIVGDHKKQLVAIKIWFIRITTALAVWSFMSGAGPVSMGTIIRLLTGK